uniref:Uncharacterized protein n=1 Tax=Coccidioides posadasii RMSCC 3488 TaxID=454284 RepID=A0A0J6FHP6_COCPO|nr:hypothetical protein CPAG_06151 [Coccidioides posadasii RMSCC 3488]
MQINNWSPEYYAARVGAPKKKSRVNGKVIDKLKCTVQPKARMLEVATTSNGREIWSLALSMRNFPGLIPYFCGWYD